ncbi:MAG: SLC13 family permease, partial [candidate division WOR-3 bacterium]
MTDLKKLLTSRYAIDAPVVTSQQELFDYVATELCRRGVEVDPKVLSAELLSREQLGSTGVGHGIALPHAILDSVSAVTAAVIRLSSPLDWGSIDKEPVRLMVLIIAPKRLKEDYLKTLAEVARALNQEQTRKLALAARTAVAAAQALAGAHRQSFFIRNRRLFVFAAVVVAVFTAARLLLPRVVLPPDWLAVSHPRDISPAALLLQQELTVTLFIAMVVGTLLFWRFRVAIAAASLGTLLVAGVMDLHTTVSFMSIPTILFIMAMMVIVRWLENIGVFRFVVTRALQSVKGIPWLLLLVLMGFSVLLGGFADEVSAILVTFGLAQEVSRRTNTPLIPYVLCLVFATNVGSALTLVGNPIGVYLAFKGGLTFEDFLRWATPISALTAVITAGLCLLLYRRHFFGHRLSTGLASIEGSNQTVDPGQLRVGLITFSTIVLLIALHGRIEQLFGLGEGTALVAAALLAVGFIVFYEQEKGRELIERGIDWWTL